MIKRNKKKHKRPPKKDFQFSHPKSDGSIKSVSTNLSVSKSKESGSEKTGEQPKKRRNDNRERDLKRNRRNRRTRSDKNKPIKESKTTVTSTKTSKSFDKNKKENTKKPNSYNKKKSSGMPQKFSIFSSDTARKPPRSRMRRQNRPSKKDIHKYSPFTLEKVSCDICGSPIKHMSSAISNQETGKTYHFDCVIKKLKNEHNLVGKQRIIYTGSGNFAIVEEVRNSDNKVPFRIVKQIEFTQIPSGENQ